VKDRNVCLKLIYFNFIDGGFKMSEKKYPLIIWFYYKDVRQLFSKIFFEKDLPKNVRTACLLATALQDLKFEVPVEIAFLTQSASIPSAIEVVRIEGVDIHTLSKESAVFSLPNISELESKDCGDICEVFHKEFDDFRKRHQDTVSEKRKIAAIEVKRCDKIYIALDF